VGGGCGGESARHSEVEAKPSIGAKAEEHLFAVGVGGAEMAPLNGTSEESGRGSAKYPLLRMEMNGDNFLAKARVPLLAREFHFSEFGHSKREGGLN